MIDLIKNFIAVFPVILFLSLLIIFDSFKLVSYKSVTKAILYGGLSAILCLLLSTVTFNYFPGFFTPYNEFVAPATEELLKGILIIYLLRNSRIGFLVDAAIFGFAIGAGFGIIENLYNYQIWAETDLLIWIMRGLGTAVMHGATTAIFALISKFLVDRSRNPHLLIYLPGLIMAGILHSLYNVFYPQVNQVIMFQLIFLPLLFWFIFRQSENLMNRWLELSLDTEVSLLEFLVSGTISRTKIGEYLDTLRKVYPGEKIVDMICYLRIYMEIFIRAKGILLMRQHGFKVRMPDEFKEKLTEFKYLEKSIGRTGKRALAPVLRTDSKEIWQIFMVSNA